MKCQILFSGKNKKNITIKHKKETKKKKIEAERECVPHIVGNFTYLLYEFHNFVYFIFFFFQMKSYLRWMPFQVGNTPTLSRPNS